MQPVSFETAEAFAHRPHTARPTLTPLPDAPAHYDKFLLQFAPVQEHGAPAVRLEAHYYRSVHGGARRLAIVLPIWGSYGYPARKTVKTLRKLSKGEIEIIEVLGDEHLIFWEALRDAPTEAEFIRIAGDMAGRVSDAVIALRRLLDWTDARPTVETTIIGFSIGAIVSSIALGVDGRFDKGVLMAGGANPGRIFATCNSKVGMVRDAALERFGWTVDDYRRLFDSLFAAGDATAFAGHYRPEDLLIIDAAFDGCMTKPSRDALWNATGRPRRIRYFANHKWAFLSMTPLTLNVAGRAIYRFVDAPAAPATGLEQQLACVADRDLVC